MSPPDAKNSRAISPTDAKPPVIGPDKPDVVSSEVFISRVGAVSLTPDQRIERIDAVLKLLGLPSVAEVNRMDAEAEAAAEKRSTKPRS